MGTLRGGVCYHGRLKFITRSQWGRISPREEHSRVEAGSITSTVAVRIVGGDEKGSLESETVKYGRESHGTRTQQ
jgi:hypothetical protein